MHTDISCPSILYEIIITYMFVWEGEGRGGHEHFPIVCVSCFELWVFISLSHSLHDRFSNMIIKTVPEEEENAN